MIIIFEETNLFINFRATSSVSNCRKNTTTYFNNKKITPEHDSALPETNETDNKSSRNSCVMEDNYSLKPDGVYDVETHNQGVTGHKTRNQITETNYSVKPEGHRPNRSLICIGCIIYTLRCYRVTIIVLYVIT
jgi:hypothetical protein